MEKSPARITWITPSSLLNAVPTTCVHPIPHVTLWFQFCPQFRSHSSTQKHLVSVFLLRGMIYMLFFFTSLVSTPSLEERYTKDELWLYKRGKKNLKNYLFFPEFPGPCSSPEEKMMSSSLVEQHWLRKYWALLAGSGMGFEHNSLHPSKHHFSGTGASACLGNHVRGRNQLSFTFW